MKPQETLSDDIGLELGAALRLAGFLMLIVLLVPVHVVYRALRPQDPFRFPRFFHKCLLRVLGFHVRVHGIMSAQAPVLFVANHSSYLDIPVLGAIVPAAFVAKADVRQWPLFGFLAKLQNTVFIERRSSRTRDQMQELRKRLDGRHSLILFPEGTSSDGMRVLPFKTSLFGTITDSGSSTPVSVQPVSIACTEIDHLPITRAWRTYYTWFGDMTLIGHLWNVFKVGRFTVDVVFHPPLSPAAFPDRKALAAHCQQQVGHGIDLCLGGRHIASATAEKITAAAQASLANAPHSGNAQ